MKMLLMMVSLLLPLGLAIAQEGAAREKEKIKQAVMDFYHEGHVTSDPSLYDEILHDTWQLFYLDEEEKLVTVNKATYKSWYSTETNDANLKWETIFHYVDVSGNNAAVKLEIKNQDFGYLDHFNMMKINGRWWIMHKISHPL